MKEGIRSTFALLALFLFISFGIPTGFLYAQNDGAGIKVIPAFIENNGGPVVPGTVLDREIKITNTGIDDKEYFIYKRNIVGVENGGVPIFAKDGEDTPGLELSEWISFPSESVVIKAGETVAFPITIAVPENAPPCSHFGGVFVSAEPPRMRQMGASVGYEVGTIVNLLISGECVEDARIRSFSTDKLFYSTKNVSFNAKIENQGNILIKPYGPLEIKGMFGNPFVTTVNEALAGVFPRTTREFIFSWNEEGIGFGRYEAILALGYQTADGQKTIDASTIFWVFPLKIILPILIGFIVLTASGYFLTRYYVNQAILRAQGGRRITTHRYRRQVGISRLTFVFVTLMGAFAVFLIFLLIMFA